MNDAERLIYYIYWNDLGADAFLFGSVVERLPLHLVKFENRMMPPGTVIQQWDSIPDFGNHPVEPQLPLLEEGREYRIRVFAIYEENTSALVRVEFLNRLGELTGTEILREKEGQFICPKDTYRYRIMLIQGGTSRVLFHHIELIPEETGRPAPDIFRKDPHNDALCVLLPEMTGNMYRVPEDRFLEGLENVVVAPAEAVMTSPFHSDDWLQAPEFRNYRIRYFIGLSGQTADAAQTLELKGLGKAVVVPGLQGLLHLKL